MTESCLSNVHAEMDVGAQNQMDIFRMDHTGNANTSGYSG